MADKILIVDDEPEMVEMLQSRLGHNGYEVITAVTGEDCLVKAEEEPGARPGGREGFIAAGKDKAAVGVYRNHRL